MCTALGSQLSFQISEETGLSCKILGWTDSVLNSKAKMPGFQVHCCEPDPPGSQEHQRWVEIWKQVVKPNPVTCSLSPSAGWGRESGGQKHKKLVDWDKKNLISEEGNTKGGGPQSDAKALTHPFPPADFFEQWLLWKNTPLPHFDCWAWHLVGNISFDQLWSTVMAASPPNVLPIPSLLLGLGRVRKKEGLDAVQALFSNS